MADERTFTETESQIIATLKETPGEKIPVSELAKRMGQEENYTWVLDRAKKLAEEGVINMSKEPYDTGRNNIQVLANMVWVDDGKKSE